MSSTTEARLKQIMSERNLRQVDILRLSEPWQKKFGISMSKSHLSQYVNGKSQPDQNKLLLLANTLNVSEGWLMGFDVPRERHTSAPNSEPSPDILPIYNQLHPARQEKVYNYADNQLKEQQNENVVPFPDTRDVVSGRETAAGAPINGDDQDSQASHTRVNVEDIPRGTDEIITVAGDSMEPDYPKYSQIFVHWQPVIESGDLAVVRVDDEGVTFKQVFIDRKKKCITLHSLNPEYSDRSFYNGEISIIGKVLN